MVRNDAARALTALRSTAFRLAAALAALAAGSAGCARPPANPPGSGEIQAELTSDPLGLDFTQARDQQTRRVLLLIGDRLLTYDAHLQIRPRIATRWERSADGRTTTFHLRDDARWHDGQRVTAADVVHTWSVYRDRAITTPQIVTQFEPLSAVRAIDDTTVEVQCDRPCTGQWNAWASFPLLPAHHPERDPEHPLGCGPWRLVQWNHGQELLLEAFAGHFEPPRSARLRMRILADYNTRYNALLAGQLDLTSLHPELAATAAVDPEFQQRFRLISLRVPFLFYIAWRATTPDRPWFDPRVRRAFTQAIDRQAYIDAVAHGLGDVGITMFHPQLPGFDPTITAWPHDPDAAASLLRQAGWVDSNHDGTLDRGGHPLRLTLLLGSNKETERLGLFVQSELARVGVDCRLEPTENARLFERMERGDYDALMTGSWLDPNADLYDALHSSQTVRGRNFAALADAEIDTLVTGLRQIEEPERRGALLTGLQRRMHELEPHTVLFYPISQLALRRDLAGVEVSPLLWDVHPGPSAWRLEPPP